MECSSKEMCGVDEIFECVIFIVVVNDCKIIEVNNVLLVVYGDLSGGIFGMIWFKKKKIRC